MGSGVLTRDPVRAQHLGPGVDVVRGDVRDPVSIGGALRGAGTVISAVHGFTGPAGVSPASVDQAGNANLIGAATATGAAVVLISVVGASPGHPIGLFRAKHAAEETLRASRVPWTIVRATAFMETWAAIMSQPLQASGKIPCWGAATTRSTSSPPPTSLPSPNARSPTADCAARSSSSAARTGLVNRSRPGWMPGCRCAMSTRSGPHLPGPARHVHCRGLRRRSRPVRHNWVGASSAWPGHGRADGHRYQR